MSDNIAPSASDSDKNEGLFVKVAPSWPML